MIANFSDPKAEGRETIGGVKTVRVTGNVSADAVNKIVPQSASRPRCRARRGSPRKATTN